jgi:hypothetical protein
VLAACTLAACGSSGAGSRSAASTAATFTSGDAATKPALNDGQSCRALVANTIGEVAARIYHAAASGSDIEQAVRRLQASGTLVKAISANDARAAGAALATLQAGQIVRVQIVKAGKVFAGVGSGPAIAPVRGPISGTDARFVLSTQAATGYAQVTRQVTGAEVLLLGHAEPAGSGARTIAGTLPAAELPVDIPTRGRLHYESKRFEVTSLTGTVFPQGGLRIALLVPPAAGRCRKLGEQARIETLGYVGERIYREEAGSPYVRATLRHIEADRGFQRAVAARDTKAIRTAILGFFAAHIHVVRVRAYAVEPSGGGQRFLYDLGGSDVLAPVHGVVRRNGKLVGRFSFAIQDDAGYLKLAQRFTGAEVIMRAGSRQVMGTLDPGPAHIPGHGPVTYRGKRYEAYSFSGEAFPSGPLRISLLQRARRAIGG